MEEKKERSESAERFAIQSLIKVNRRHRQCIENGVAFLGMHRSAHYCLMHLCEEGKCPSQKELAEKFRVSPAAVTGILKRLERDGYIRRTLGADNRTNAIIITDSGREIVSRSKEIFDEVDKQCFRGFTDEEYDTLLRLLDKIADNIENIRVDAQRADTPADTAKQNTQTEKEDTL